jgi:regulator of nonsense transcripts 2
MRALKELVNSFFLRHTTTHLASVQLSNDPTLSSLPLLTIFLKSYSRPYLGITPPPPSKQILSDLGSRNQPDGVFPELTKESDELIEQEIRDRFKRMCEGYYDNVCKKLVIEHKVCFRHIFLDIVGQILFKQRLQEQDKRNHEAYIRSGEIFEDRQQAYEKMTKGYEKLLASCQS